MKKNDLRIVFMGTPDFAVASLKALVNQSYNIVGVITSVDKPAGRGKKLRQSAVKEYALSANLNVLQPPNLKDPNFIENLKALNADLQIIVAFRMLPEIVWDMPSMGTFNLHASLLPQYRGAAPINHVIINGELKTGLTTFFLDKQIDTGRIIKQIELDILKTDNAGSLHDRMMDAGACLVLETVNLILNDAVVAKDQIEFIEDEIILNSAPKIFKDDCKIDWTKDTSQIFDFIRGMSPYPTAYTNILLEDGQLIYIKVFSALAEEMEHRYNIGAIIIIDGFLKVAVKNGFIILIEIQQSGKKRMKVSNFLRGINLENASVEIYN